MRPQPEQIGPPAGVVLGVLDLGPLSTTLTLGSRGTLTLPAGIRRALAIEAGGKVLVEVTSDGVLLRPVVAFECDFADLEATVAPLARSPRRRRIQ